MRSPWWLEASSPSRLTVLLGEALIPGGGGDDGGGGGDGSGLPSLLIKVTLPLCGRN